VVQITSIPYEAVCSESQIFRATDYLPYTFELAAGNNDRPSCRLKNENNSSSYVSHNILDLSTELMGWIGHRKEIEG